MTYLNNQLHIYFRRLLKNLNKGYRYYKQKPDFETIIRINFNKDQKFSFVQVGANDGISFDVLYNVVKERDSQGIVIEPVREYFEQLEKLYSEFPKIIKVNKAVHPTESVATIYKVSNDALNKYPDWVKGIASLNPNHHLKTKIDTKDMVTEEVSCDTFMNIIDEYKNQPLDLIQIDTEGFDFEIIKMIDFELVRPKIIKYESGNLSEMDRKESIKLLRKYKYYTFNIGIDTLAVNLNKIKLSWK